MVFFGTYRNARLVPQNFMKPWVDWFRSIGEFHNARPWAHGAFLIPGFSNMTTFLFWLVPWYFLQRQYMIRQWDNDEYERTLIQRWGPTLEDVRKNLSAEDQVRARGFHFFERVHGNFLGNKWKIHPAGSDIAGPNHH